MGWFAGMFTAEPAPTPPPDRSREMVEIAEREIALGKLTAGQEAFVRRLQAFWLERARG